MIFLNIIVLILFLAAHPVVQEAQKLDTIYLEFERKAVQGDTTEAVNGVAYYQSPGKVLIEVQEPVNQIMLINGSEMLIYYPVEKKAFRIKAKVPLPMPFVQSILSVFFDD